MKGLMWGATISLALAAATSASSPKGVDMANVGALSVVCLTCQEAAGGHWFWVEDPECGEIGPDFGDLEGTYCSRCGGTSECHPFSRPGPCHLPCDMSLAEMASEVETLLAQIDAARSAPDPAITALLDLIAVESALSVRESTQAIRLADCGGRAVEQWPLPLRLSELSQLAGRG